MLMVKNINFDKLGYEMIFSIVIILTLAGLASVFWWLKHKKRIEKENNEIEKEIASQDPMDKGE